jgi:single-stranded-DNA-specific exonuclease
VKQENIEELRNRLGKYVESALTSDDDLRPRFRVDAQLSLDEVNVPMMKGLASLEPHGIGNPKPVFLLEGATVRRLMTMEEKDLKLVLSGRAGGAIEAVWWDGIAFEDQAGSGSVLDFVVTCDLNEYQGRVKPQLTIKDARLA